MGNQPSGRAHPDGPGWYNVRLDDGKRIATYADARPDFPGSTVINGPWTDQKTAIARARPDLLYPHLLRQAMARGIVLKDGTELKPTIAQVGDWSDYSKEAVQSWLRPHTSRSHRDMPRKAIRLVLHEFALRDHSHYKKIGGWIKLLTLCD